MFPLILFLGLFIIGCQWMAAFLDGFCFRSQLARGGRSHAFALVEHGGMWMDVFLITPLVAWMVSAYPLEYNTTFGYAALFAALMVVMAVAVMFRNSDEAYAHDGRTSLAGLFHWAYAWLALWVFTLFFFRNPAPRAHHLVAAAMCLTPFYFLGVVKFRRHWRPRPADVHQALLLNLVMWTVVAVRISHGAH